jgi:hypothetical protein
MYKVNAQWGSFVRLFARNIFETTENIFVVFDLGDLNFNLSKNLISFRRKDNERLQTNMVTTKRGLKVTVNCFVSLCETVTM